MAEGTKTYHGLAVPLFGESEIQAQTAATDILTITGASAHTGDFIVCQNSTGAELFVVSSSGLVTSAVGASFSGVTAFSGTLTGTLSSTAASYSIGVSVTSTGALAVGATGVNAVLVSASSKSVLNSVIGYYTPDSAVGTCNAFLTVYGSKAPSYLLSVGASAAGLGAATDNGFFEAATRFISAPSTSITYGAVKILAGSKCYYLLAIPDTSMADT